MVVSLIGSLDDVQVQRVLLVAAYAGVTLKVVQACDGRDNASESYKLNCHPLQQLPVMKTDEGYLFTIHAMVRYLARTEAPLRTTAAAGNSTSSIAGGSGAAMIALVDNDAGKFPHPQYPIPYTLYGNNLLSSAHVDAWLDFVAYKLDVHTLPLLRARSLRAAAAAAATTPRSRTPRAAMAESNTTAGGGSSSSMSDEEAAATAAARQLLWPQLRIVEQALLQLYTQRKQLLHSSGGALTARTLATTEYDTLLLQQSNSEANNYMNSGSSAVAHKRASMTGGGGGGGSMTGPQYSSSNACDATTAAAAAAGDEADMSRDSALYNGTAAGNSGSGGSATALSRLGVGNRQSQLSAVYNVTEAVETRMDSIARLTRSDEARESIRRHTELLDSTPTRDTTGARVVEQQPQQQADEAAGVRDGSIRNTTTAAAATTGTMVPLLQLPQRAQSARSRSRSTSRAMTGIVATAMTTATAGYGTTVASTRVQRHDLVFVVGDSLTAADVVLAMGLHAVYNLPSLRADAVRAFPHAHRYYKSILMLPVAADVRKALRMTLVTI